MVNAYILVRLVPGLESNAMSRICLSLFLLTRRWGRRRLAPTCLGKCWGGRAPVVIQEGGAE